LFIIAGCLVKLLNRPGDFTQHHVILVGNRGESDVDSTDGFEWT
jgi:hypothetical protein